MDLLAFLHARLDDDERLGTLHTRVADEIGLAADPCDPRGGIRIVADAAAKRRMVERADAAIHLADETPEGAPNAAQRQGQAAAWEAVLEFLTEPYADHPDYDPEWKP
jgi:hypothetical protein